MFAVFARRAAEPPRGNYLGEPTEPKWFGLHGAFLTIEYARECKAAINEKHGYADIRIVELKEVK